MFYAHFVLQKKGPLARIWLAAHWDKKLTKAQVFETNIETSVDGILQPKVKIALRTSGHLLLGVVRIYSRKAKYLLADCNEAFVKIKMAFRPGMVDLPEEHREAAVNAITLPEVFHDFDATMPELNDVDIEAQFSLNQSRAEEITMREDYGNLCLVTNDEGFGDMGFDNEPPDLLRNAASLDRALDQSHLLFSEPDHMTCLDKDKEPQASTSAAIPSRSLEIDTPIRGDGFGGNLGQDIMGGGLFEGGLSLFDDTPMVGDIQVPEPPVDGAQSHIQAKSPAAPSIHDTDDEDHHFEGPPSIGGHSSNSSRPNTPLPDTEHIAQEEVQKSVTPAREEPKEQVKEDKGPVADQTTLIQNEEESFALAPVDASAIRGFQKTKRKRKLIVDEVKNISGEEMKAQLSDTSDIVTTLDLAPPTKRLMHWKESGGVEKLFALPDRSIPARVLFKNYQRHLTLKAIENEDHEPADKQDQITLEQIRDAEGENIENVAPTPGKRGSKRRRNAEPEEPVTQKKGQTADALQQSLPVPDQFLSPASIAPPATPLNPDMSRYNPPTPAPEIAPPTPAMSDAYGRELVPPGTPGYIPMQTPVNLMAPGTPAGILAPATPGGLLAPATPGGLLAPATPAGLLAPATPAGMLAPQTPADLLNPPTPSMYAPQTPGGLLGPQSNCMMGPQTPQPSHTNILPPHTPGLLAPHTPAPHLPMEDIPQLQPDQLHSILGAGHQTLMENMGYDQNNPMMANMGYDEQHPPAHTPGNVSEKGQATPWNEEYEFPNSAGPPEEQQVDETYEQFEERVLNKRAAHMYHILKSRLARHTTLHFSEMTHRNNKKQVAQKFYTLLVLKKTQVLELEQQEAYDEIVITKGSKFENPSL